MRFLGLLALFSVVAILVAACGGGGGEATPVAEKSPSPTATKAAVATFTSVVAASPTATRAPAATLTPTTGPAGDVEAGKLVFSSSACGACHAVRTLTGAVGVVGPALDGLASVAGTRKPGLSAEAYIKESIESPGAFTVSGFANIMPPLRGNMTDKQFQDLIAFLLTLK